MVKDGTLHPIGGNFARKETTQGTNSSHALKKIPIKQKILYSNY